LSREPDWGALPDDTPPNVKRVLERCLEKGRERRLQDIADARRELENALATFGPGSRHSKGTQRAWMAAAAVLVLIAAGAGVWLLDDRAGEPVTSPSEYE
jgi:hypothetical protein